ncbi:dicarboxylate/amino acid:cation symporter [Caloramator sp. Dgby_cultured_2]|uniref:dicarboxylate/amino acid:cation symporter n=1 Tax=Caloramator sp. Dgby_cultured_2 TaxID=3029174 RepID=UPI00237DCECB|nr:cation:dicarboxylase symporter family transporter [Caloramator sp. Dgby_cultured_2]WDU82183.1 cation:dicarboxylase symporter family transporter [Caloramator sp. Dgby_cultured_2]
MSTVFALILTTISFSIIKFIKNKKVSFSLISLIALTLGLISGIVLKNEENVFSLIGQTYISLIKMLVLPLIITSIITSINKFSNTDDLKRIAIKAISILMLTTAIATFIGLLVGNILNVGAGYNFINVPEFKAREIPKFTQVFLDMIPKNPVNEMANGKIIPVIIFSILIAISLAIEGEKIWIQ